MHPGTILGPSNGILGNPRQSWGNPFHLGAILDIPGAILMQFWYNPEQSEGNPGCILWDIRVLQDPKQSLEILMDALCIIAQSWCHPVASQA